MKRHGLDAIDMRILSAVQAHGPLSKVKLSEMVNLSPTPCWERLRKLTEAGFIRGYYGDIAVERICDVSKVVVTIALRQHRKSDFERFEARVMALDEVVDCVATGGGMDYVLTVVAKDLASFQALMEALLAEDLGIERYMTYIATRQVKAARPNLTALSRL